MKEHLIELNKTLKRNNFYTSSGAFVVLVALVISLIALLK